MTELRAMSNLPRKANLGCGFDKRPGFLNIDLNDFHEPDLVGDVTSLPDLPGGYFEFILAQDVLEHLERGKAPLALLEWSRLLAPGGVLELRLPSLLDLMQMLAWPSNRPAAKAAEIMHLLFGTQAYSGDFHLSGYTAELLADLLAAAGLLVCKAAIRDQWLFEVSARKTDELTEDLEFVHHSYFTILGRPVDPDGAAAFVGQLGSGQITRGELLDSLANSEEARFMRLHPRYLWPHREHMSP